MRVLLGTYVVPRASVSAAGYAPDATRDGDASTDAGQRGGVAPAAPTESAPPDGVSAEPNPSGNGAPPADPPIPRCLWCGWGPLERPRRGRMPLYCDPRHRKRMWTWRRRVAEGRWVLGDPEPVSPLQLRLPWPGAEVTP